MIGLQPLKTSRADPTRESPGGLPFCVASAQKEKKTPGEAPGVEAFGLLLLVEERPFRAVKSLSPTVILSAARGSRATKGKSKDPDNLSLH
jgi:hypothetical protein